MPCIWCGHEDALLVVDDDYDGLGFDCLCAVRDLDLAWRRQLLQERQNAACAEFDALQLARDMDMDSKYLRRLGAA